MISHFKCINNIRIEKVAVHVMKITVYLDVVVEKEQLSAIMVVVLAFRCSRRYYII